MSTRRKFLQMLGIGVAVAPTVVRALAKPAAVTPAKPIEYPSPSFLKGVTHAQRMAIVPSDGLIVWQTNNVGESLSGLKVFADGRWCSIKDLSTINN